MTIPSLKICIRSWRKKMNNQNPSDSCNLQLYFCTTVSAPYALWFWRGVWNWKRSRNKKESQTCWFLHVEHHGMIVLPSMIWLLQNLSCCLMLRVCSISCMFHTWSSVWISIMNLSVNSDQYIECKFLHVRHQKPCIRVEPNDSLNCMKRIKSCLKDL